MAENPLYTQALARTQEGRKAKTPRPLMLAYDYREMVNELREVAVQWHGSQQLRARIENVIGKHIVPTSQAVLTTSLKQGQNLEG
jgi:hypothetical protein